jgi:anti-anti-sigma factor
LLDGQPRPVADDKLSAARLRVRLVTSPELDVVVAEGEVDAATSVGLARVLQRLMIDRDGDGVVDLRKVRFMDSTGARQLIDASRRLNRNSRSFSVICAPGAVHRILEKLGLIETLNVVCSKQDR